MHLEGKLQLPPSQEYLKQEVDNIISVCNAEVQNLMNNTLTKGGLCKKQIESYNEQILHKLELDEGVVPGQLRRHSVVVGNVYRGAPAEDCDYLLGQLCEWLDGDDFIPPDDELIIPYALIKAIVAHVYLAWIHPFGDGNGRTARLVEFHILFSSGLPLPAAHLLSDHYNRTRTKYYRELDRTSKAGGDLMPFIKYAVQGFLDGLREQIEGVRQHQMSVAWENYVHETFQEKRTSPTQKRRRDLVLELSRHDWVNVSEIDELSPALARLYATAGDRMLQRDLNALAKMNLVERRRGKVRARKSLIQAFLPVRASESA